jgi:SAM-dependent methyltransferase
MKRAREEEVAAAGAAPASPPSKRTRQEDGSRESDTADPLAQWVANVREQLAPVASYDPHRRSSRAVVDASGALAPQLERARGPHGERVFEPVLVFGGDGDAVEWARSALLPGCVVVLRVAAAADAAPLLARVTALCARMEPADRVKVVVFARANDGVAWPRVAAEQSEWRGEGQPLALVACACEYEAAAKSGGREEAAESGRDHGARDDGDERRRFQLLYACRDRQGSRHVYQRLLKLLGTRLFKHPEHRAAMERCLHEAMARGADDEETLNALREVFQSFGLPAEEPPDYRRDHRAEEVVEALPRSFRERLRAAGREAAMLDIGCAEGAITAAVGFRLGLPEECVFGCDVRDVPGARGFRFRVVREDERLAEAYSDELRRRGGFDLVTLFMSLHHLRDPGAMLAQVRRLLRPDGLLLIREHDSESRRMDALIDVLHGMYARVWSNPPEMPQFCGAFRAWYRSRSEWRRKLERQGFEAHPDSPDADHRYERPRFDDHSKTFPNAYQSYLGLYRVRASRR